MTDKQTEQLTKLPLTFRFDRQAEEQVEVMYSITNWIIERNNNAKKHISHVLLWAALFLVSFIAFRYLEDFGLTKQAVLLFAIGLFIAFVGTMAFTTWHFKNVMKLMEGELEPGLMCEVIIESDGIRSFTGGLKIETKWDEIRDLRLKENRITVFGELMAHYVPERALNENQSLEDLFSELQARANVNQSGDTHAQSK